MKGFDITGTGSGSFAVAGGSGDASGTMADNILHGASAAGGLTLNGTSGTWSVSDLTATGTGGAAFDANAAGTVNFSGTDSLTGTGAGAFKNAGATTYSGTISTTSSTGGAANGIDVSGAFGSITFNGGTLSGTTSNAILAAGGNGNVTYNGTESNAAGHSVNVSGRTGGTITIGSSINDAGTGITLTNNTGATINLTNTITANTGANTAFAATGGGTISATGSGNTLATSTGTALNVANTTIGASGLTFRSIAANGAVNGIVLNNTGSSGGLTVSGDGSSDPANTTRGNTTAKAGGGTITPGSGGTIQNTTASGIVLTSTGPVSLTSMKIQSPSPSGQSVNSGNNGITATSVNGLSLDNVYVNGFTGNSGLRGTSVANLQMQHVDIDGNGTATGTETNDNWNVRLNDLSGNCGDATNGCGWNNSLFFQSRENIVGIVQSAGSTANLRMTVSNSEFRDTTTFASPANDAFLIEGNGSAVTNITATGSTFKNVEVTGFQYVGNDNSSGSVNVRNNVFENTGTDINIAHAGGTPTTAQTLNFDVSGNTERQQTGNPASTVAVNIFLAGNSLSGSSMVGTIKNNTIGNATVSGSGSHVGDGIDINSTGAGTITATVSGNTVHQIHQGDALFAEANSGSAKLNVSVHNNSLNVDQTGTALAGGHFVGGADPSTDSSTLCLDTLNGANTFHGDTTYTGVELDALGNSNGIRLVGYGGATSTTPGDPGSGAIANFLVAQNTSVTPSPSGFIIPSNGATIAGTSSCGVTFPP